jgi:YfiH family protein
MNRHQLNGLAYYTFPSLDPFRELVHAVTTRHGGVSTGQYATLNLSKTLGDDPEAVEENMSRVCAAVSVRREQLVSPRQRHTARVRRVGPDDRDQTLDGYDVLITDQPGVPLLLVYADCVPVLIYDPRHRALALAHSGWRGTVLGAVRAAVDALGREFGSRPARLIAAIGPSIGPCCYEVGDEVADVVRATFPRPAGLLPVRSPGRLHFDLWAANYRWLTAAGVRQIEVARLCTACHTDEFYSHRAEGGQTGHFGTVMGLRVDK